MNSHATTCDNKEYKKVLTFSFAVLKSSTQMVLYSVNILRTGNAQTQMNIQVLVPHMFTIVGVLDNSHLSVNLFPLPIQLI